MSDQDLTTDVEATSSSRFNLIAIILILVALTGAFVSASYSHTLSDLLREKSDFEKLFGELKVDDPSRVAIISISPTAVELPTWVDSENLSVFRVRIPANYNLSFSTNSGMIAADSPLSTSHGGGSTHGAKTEAMEFQLIVNTTRENGRLKVSLLSYSGTSLLSTPKKLSVASPEDLVLDTIMKPGEPIRTFSADEAICIWRLRSKTPGKKMLNNTKLYPSCAIYMYQASKRNAFQRWARGQSSSMNP